MLLALILYLLLLLLVFYHRLPLQAGSLVVGLGALVLHAVSGGIAYVDPRFSVDGSVRQTVSGDSATAIVFGFTMHVEASGLGATQSTDF